MNDLVVSGEKAKLICEVFPLARFSQSIMRALGEDKDERFAQNLQAIFQIQELRAIYGILETQIPGLSLIFPLFFAKNDKENCSVVWVGEHDPYGLGDMVVAHATTYWTLKDNDLNIHVSWENVGMIGCHCCLRRNDFARFFTQTVAPELFNEVFFSFFKSLGAYVFCPKRDKEGYKHPEECSLCGNESRVRINKIFGSKFRPSRWFEMLTDVRGWDKP